jgi:hypothetical protein
VIVNIAFRFLQSFIILVKLIWWTDVMFNHYVPLIVNIYHSYTIIMGMVNRQVSEAGVIVAYSAVEQHFRTS